MGRSYSRRIEDTACCSSSATQSKLRRLATSQWEPKHWPGGQRRNGQGIGSRISTGRGAGLLIVLGDLIEPPLAPHIALFPFVVMRLMFTNTQDAWPSIRCRCYCWCEQLSHHHTAIRTLRLSLSAKHFTVPPHHASFVGVTLCTQSLQPKPLQTLHFRLLRPSRHVK